jgi:LacI family transcriptional regulator, galactose operon repressor
MRRVSIRDVARLAGVSPGTASRVLSGSTYPVSDGARKQVEEAAQALNYVTNSAARALVTGHSEIVGAIVHDITDPFFSGVVRGLQDAAVAAGLVVMVGNDDRDAAKLEGYLEMLLSQNPMGVVLIGGQLRDPAATLPVAQAVQRLRDQGVPVVAVGRYELDIPHVAVDDVAAAESAVAHLLDLGHRRIAFLGGPLNSTTVQDRYTGYANALARAGIPVDEELVVQVPLTVEGGSQGVESLVTAGTEVTGVFAATDTVAFGTISALRDHGLRVPVDVSVVGFDDIVMAAHTDPPLTTVHVPARELGLGAWRLLKLGGRVNARPGSERVPVDLVVRASTAAPRGESSDGRVPEPSPVMADGRNSRPGGAGK